MISLLIATRNAHKTAEFAHILGAGFEVKDLGSMPHLPEVEETGRTFEENATLKALAASAHSTELVVADDSGLEVDALGGAPGVYSARYAGAGATDRENVVKLLGALEALDSADPQFPARFRCVLALAQHGKLRAMFDGVVTGNVTTSAAGAAGFGYDPVFIPQGYCETFAVLGPDVKNRASHRARAIAQLQRYLLGAAPDGVPRS